MKEQLSEELEHSSPGKVPPNEVEISLRFLKPSLDTKVTGLVSNNDIFKGKETEDGRWRECGGRVEFSEVFD